MSAKISFFLFVCRGKIPEIIFILYFANSCSLFISTSIFSVSIKESNDQIASRLSCVPLKQPSVWGFTILLSSAAPKCLNGLGPRLSGFYWINSQQGHKAKIPIYCPSYLDGEKTWATKLEGKCHGKLMSSACRLNLLKGLWWNSESTHIIYCLHISHQSVFWFHHCRFLRAQFVGTFAFSR